MVVKIIIIDVVIIIIIITCLEIVFQPPPSISEHILIKRHKQSVLRWTVAINSIEKIIIIKMVGAKRLVNPWVFWCAVEARSY